MLPDYFFDDVRETACLKSCSEMKMTFGFPFVSDSGLATSFVKLYFKSSVYVKKSVYSYRCILADSDYCPVQNVAALVPDVACCVFIGEKIFSTSQSKT